MLEYLQIESGFNYTNFRRATFANIKPIPGAKVKTAGWGHNKVKPICNKNGFYKLKKKLPSFFFFHEQPVAFVVFVIPVFR